MALPKTLYVYEQTDNDGSKYIVACRDPAEWDDDGQMGVYGLVGLVKTKHRVEVTPVARKRARS